MNRLSKELKVLFVSPLYYLIMIKPNLYSLKLMQVGRVLGLCCCKVVLVVRSSSKHLKQMVSISSSEINSNL